jgi:hypothetical protein
MNCKPESPEKSGKILFNGFYRACFAAQISLRGQSS